MDFIPLMYQLWQCNIAGTTAKLASSFICHPSDCTWQDGIVAEWAKAHPDEISQGASSTDLEHLWKVRMLPIIEEIEPIGEFGKEGWNYISTYFEELFDQGVQK